MKKSTVSRKVEWLQTPCRESMRRDTATLATATDTELEESDLFADVLLEH